MGALFKPVFLFKALISATELLWHSTFEEKLSLTAFVVFLQAQCPSFQGTGMMLLPMTGCGNMFVLTNAFFSVRDKVCKCL